ncbi:MAG: adenylate/guanylate cyclase domain-containing protein [Polyangiaceae bacterium]
MSGKTPSEMERAAMRGEERLWRLIEERTHPHADTQEIDRRIWDMFGEEWTIVFSDLAGFSRHSAEFGIVHFLQIIYEQTKLLLPVIERHDGLLVKREADSLMLLFRQPAAAVRCCLEMLKTLSQVNHRRRPEEQILLCLGIGYGRILRIGDHEIFGAEVNAASKLGEDIAGPDEVLITDAVRAKLDPARHAAGEPRLEIAGTGVLELVDLEREAGGSARNWKLLTPH